MMNIMALDETESELNRHIDIYDAKLTFRKTKENILEVIVQIRYSKRERQKKVTFPVPEHIKIDYKELDWISYHGRKIAIYHRQDNCKYINMQHSMAHASLNPELERLVREVYSKNSLPEEI